MRTASEIENDIYWIRSRFYSPTLDIDIYCKAISELRREYFNLTGKEFIPATYTD